MNHASQPTYKSPTRAADFFVEAYRAIKPKCSFCNVVALDVLDQVGVERYMRSFYRHLSLDLPAARDVVGIHNYGDVNRQRTTFTKSIISQAHEFNKKTRFWFTETGGLVKFGASFPCSEERAKNRLKHMFSLARTLPDERRRAALHLQLDRPAERVRRALRRRPHEPRRHGRARATTTSSRRCRTTSAEPRRVAARRLLPEVRRRAPGTGDDCTIDVVVWPNSVKRSITSSR